MRRELVSTDHDGAFCIQRRKPCLPLCGSGYWPDHEALRAFSFPGQYLPPMGVSPFRLGTQRAWNLSDQHLSRLTYSLLFDCDDLHAYPVALADAVFGRPETVAPQ